jgi:preprotein translocase subunit YajC
MLCVFTGQLHPAPPFQTKTQSIMSSPLNLIFAQAAAPESTPAPTPAPSPAPAPESAPAPAAPPAPAADNGALPVQSGQSTAPQTTTGTTVPAPDAQSKAPPQEGGNMFFSVSLILLFVAMYFLFIRPQQKREKEIRKRQSELKNGDSVVTSSGMFGKVVGIDADKVTLQLGEGVRIVFQRQAIVGFASSEKNESDKK